MFASRSIRKIVFNLFARLTDNLKELYVAFKDNDSV